MANASPAPRMATATHGDLVRMMSKGFGGAAGRRVMPNSCGLADDGDDGAAAEVVVRGRRAGSVVLVKKQPKGVRTPNSGSITHNKSS